MKQGIRSAVGALVLTIVLAGCDAANIVGSLADVSNTDHIVMEAFQFDVDLTTETEFRLEGVNGTIQVAADPTATVVRVSGERRVGSSSTADAREHLPRVQVLVDQTSEAIVVRTQQPENTRGRNYVVDYTVTAPPHLLQIVGNVNGNITIIDAACGATVGNVNGNIDLIRVTGPVAAGLVNGNIVADVSLPEGDDVSLAAVNGNLTLVLNGDASARLVASWTNGGFASSNIDVRLEEVRERSVRGVLGAGDGEIALGTTNGQILVQGRD